MKRNRYVVSPIDGRYGIWDKFAGKFVGASFDRNKIERQSRELNDDQVGGAERRQLDLF